MAATLAGCVLQPVAPEAGNAFRDCADCPDMVVIPPGRFMMGAVPGFIDHLPSEVPRHPVTIVKAFAMGRFEVTRAQFAAFVRDTGYRIEPGCVYWNLKRKDWDFDAARNWERPGFPQGDDHPVVCVPWRAAKAFVEWLSRRTGQAYRLPSEAEWEYAARAGTATRWHWGDALGKACRHANLSDASAKASYAHWMTFACDDRYPYTAPVGTYQPNAFGLHDVIGNAWEWTEDCFHPNYTGAPEDGRPWLEGPCAKRVSRGNSYYTPPRSARVSFRLDGSPGYRMVQYGFRVVRDW